MNTQHLKLKTQNFLPLTLLKAWVFLVDNVQNAFATNDFAIGATLFNGGSYFHVGKLKRVDKLLVVDPLLINYL